MQLKQMAAVYSRQNVESAQRKYAYTSLKALEKCTQLVFLPFDLIVLAKYKGT